MKIHRTKKPKATGLITNQALQGRSVRSTKWNQFVLVVGSRTREMTPVISSAR
jgi:hypothetical protein